jgi:hypothetical protein
VCDGERMSKDLRAHQRAVRTNVLLEVEEYGGLIRLGETDRTENNAEQSTES